MTRRERWLSAFAMLVSILPFIVIASTLQIMPNLFSIQDILQMPLATVQISKYNFLFSSFLCLIPLLLVITARILKAKRVVGRNFTAMVLSGMVLGLVFLAVSLFSIIHQLVQMQINLLKTFDFFGTAAILLSLLMGMIANFLPDLKPNEMLGLKNRYTMRSDTVWNKVHHDATDVFMSTFFALAIVLSGLSIIINFRYGWIHLAVWFIVTGVMFGWAYLYSRKVFNELPVKPSKEVRITDPVV